MKTIALTNSEIMIVVDALQAKAATLRSAQQMIGPQPEKTAGAEARKLVERAIVDHIRLADRILESARAAKPQERRKLKAIREALAATDRCFPTCPGWVIATVAAGPTDMGPEACTGCYGIMRCEECGDAITDEEASRIPEACEALAVANVGA